MKMIAMISTCIIGLAGITFSCSEQDKTSLLEVRLTDAPADYDEVLIDVRDVQIHVSGDGDEEGWQSLQVNSGVYNLLDFRNGMDTLLATLELPAGHVSQMRLILGDNNLVTIDGEEHHLETPSAQQSGLKFNIDADLTQGIVYTLWIDFDAGRSIVKRGNGKYNLKPVIRTFTRATTGAIQGIVSPDIALPYVMAVSDGDTTGSYAGDDGRFLLKAIPEGTYQVLFDAAEAYADTVIDGITVTMGSVTEMDTVFFRLHE